MVHNDSKKSFILEVKLKERKIRNFYCAEGFPIIARLVSKNNFMLSSLNVFCRWATLAWFEIFEQFCALNVYIKSREIHRRAFPWTTGEKNFIEESSSTEAFAVKFRCSRSFDCC